MIGVYCFMFLLLFKNKHYQILNTLLWPSFYLIEIMFMFNNCFQLCWLVGWLVS